MSWTCTVPLVTLGHTRYNRTGALRHTRRLAHVVDLHCSTTWLTKRECICGRSTTWPTKWQRRLEIARGRRGTWSRRGSVPCLLGGLRLPWLQAMPPRCRSLSLSLCLSLSVCLSHIPPLTSPSLLFLCHTTHMWRTLQACNVLYIGNMTGRLIDSDDISQKFACSMHVCRAAQQGLCASDGCTGKGRVGGGRDTVERGGEGEREK